MVRRWRSWFLEGRQNVHDDERSGRPVTATDNAAVAAVRNVVEANRRVTIDEIMIRLPPGIEIGCSSIGTIMSDVFIRDVSGMLNHSDGDGSTRLPDISGIALVAREGIDSTTRTERTRMKGRSDTSLTKQKVSSMYRLHRKMSEEWREVIHWSSDLMTTSATTVERGLPNRDIFLWRRYIDDTFCLVSEVSASHILSDLNSFHPDIAFTHETENHSVLPFLDTLVIRTPSKPCKFGGMLIEMLRDKLVVGVRSENLQKRLLQEGDDATLDKIYQIALSYEAAERDLLSMKKVDYADANVHDVKKLNSACSHCGRHNHLSNKCFFKNAKCHECGKTGHIKPACKNRKTKYIKIQNGSKATGKINVVEASKNGKYFITLNVDNKNIQFEFDTGSCHTLMPINLYKKLWNKKIVPINLHLKSYSNTKIDVIGKREVFVAEANKSLPLIITEANRPVLLGTTWIKCLPAKFLKFSDINLVQETTCSSLVNKFAEVFGTSNVGVIKDHKAHLILRKDANPRFFRARNVPYVMRNAIEKELENLEAQGLYRYNRLPFGIASAPAIWQRIIEQILSGIPGTLVYLDDILITGESEADHLRHLEAVLNRLNNYGLKANREKCNFFQESLEYCGHVIDKMGLPKTNDKIRAVLDAPKPLNVTQLRSFLGLITYYHKFIRNAADVLSPLYALLKKGTKWHWSTECRKAFREIKETISSDQILIAYDPKLPIRLSCDSSSYRLGAVLSQIDVDGNERPIYFISRTLSQAEKKYSQIDKECLSIIWALKKFNNYLFGRKFELITDNKPLHHILNPKREISSNMSARLQRWTLILSSYNFTIECRKTGDHGNADGLSRLPLEQYEEMEEDAVNTVHMIKQCEELPLTSSHIRRESCKDSILKIVYQNTLEELTVEQGILLLGTRVVIPRKFRAKIKTELHQGHLGVVKMKALARNFIWWPGIDREIEEITRVCRECNINNHTLKQESVHRWKSAPAPWYRVHLDFAGPFMKRMFLIVIDSYSKWPEVIIMNSTTAGNTIRVLRDLFSRYGISDQVVTDNGPQFVSEEMKYFSKSNGVHHLRSSPYFPATNGLAERFVQTLKRGLKNMRNEELNKSLANFLFTYRTVPHSSTREAPAVLFLKRMLKCKWNLLKPNLEVKPGFKKGYSPDFEEDEDILSLPVKRTFPPLQESLHQKSPVPQLRRRTRIGRPSEAQSIFETYDNQADRSRLSASEKLDRLPLFLVQQPLQYFQFRLDFLQYFQARQTLMDLYPSTSEAIYSKYYALRLQGQSLEEYYRTKTAMGLQLGLLQEAILETFTEGLPFGYQQLVRIIPPTSLTECYDRVTRIREYTQPSEQWSTLYLGTLHQHPEISAQVFQRCKQPATFTMPVLQAPNFLRHTIPSPNCRLPKSQLNRIPKSQLNRLPKSQLNRLPKSQLHRLPKFQLNRLPKSQFHRLPKSQLHRLPKFQLNRLPKSKFHRLPKSQLNRLPKPQLGRLPKFQLHILPNPNFTDFPDPNELTVNDEMSKNPQQDLRLLLEDTNLSDSSTPDKRDSSSLSEEKCYESLGDCEPTHSDSIRVMKTPLEQFLPTTPSPASLRQHERIKPPTSRGLVYRPCTATTFPIVTFQHEPRFNLRTRSLQHNPASCPTEAHEQ
ncbi:K02A2.6-like [Cordylochernes scorpioides]|uniref:RNA-directed DNA polymerase n=1 Tax=Cordylochernes scorpioides TaxID=51811 RepID=A0ABY6KW23_9ARAC|nr:K02A2.6-like [Cordylochernes scorpioides]